MVTDWSRSHRIPSQARPQASQARRRGSRPGALEPTSVDVGGGGSRLLGVPDDSSVVGLERVRPVLTGALLRTDPEDPVAVALECEALLIVHVQVPVAREDHQAPLRGFLEPGRVCSRLSGLLVAVEVGERETPIAAGLSLI